MPVFSLNLIQIPDIQERADQASAISSIKVDTIIPKDSAAQAQAKASLEKFAGTLVESEKNIINDIFNDQIITSEEYSKLIQAYADDHDISFAAAVSDLGVSINDLLDDTEAVMKYYSSIVNTAPKKAKEVLNTLNSHLADLADDDFDTASAAKDLFSDINKLSISAVFCIQLHYCVPGCT